MELLVCFDEQPGNKVRGINLVSKADYGIDVADTIYVDCEQGLVGTAN